MERLLLLALQACLAVLLLLLPALPAAGEIYRWRDTSGQEHFTSDLQQVPEGHRRQALDAARAGESGAVNYHEATPRETPAPEPAVESPPAKRGEAVEYDCDALRRQARVQLDAIARKQGKVERREDSVSDIAGSILSEHLRKKSLARGEGELEALRADYERWRKLHRRRGVPPGCLR